MEELLEQLLEECRPYTLQGQVATYIPELAKGDRNDFGIYVLRSDGRHYQVGDYKKCFTIQSVVKPILLLLALMDNGEEYVRSRVGVEATGKPFDAINVTDQTLLNEHLNPMVNMGAIAMCTLLKGADYNERFQRLLDLTRTLANNPEIKLDMAVYHSEKRTGNKNRALAFLLKTYGMIQDDVEDVLECYFKACSISVNSKDLANIGFVLANRG
ncbi:MAG: glutaminase, partial [Lawsonibacter sp.]|nr:glutaminase [Lawsonibacter sp.]